MAPLNLKIDSIVLIDLTTLKETASYFYYQLKLVELVLT